MLKFYDGLCWMKLENEYSGRHGKITPPDSSSKQLFTQNHFLLCQDHIIVFHIMRHGEITPSESSKLKIILCYEKPHFI